MNQQKQDFIQILSDTFRFVFASSSFRDLFLCLLGVFVFVTIMHWMALLFNPFQNRHAKPSDRITGAKPEAEKEAEKETSCAFCCECEDCIYYESHKYCSRCDRFEICAYCSARGHCDL